MMQASWWEDTAMDESKVLVHIAKIAVEDLRMADGEGFVIKDVRVQGTHINLSYVSFLAV
jgi:hypothetical protein